MTNKYIKKYLKEIKDSKTDEEIDVILHRVYEDGFDDGCRKDD